MKKISFVVLISIFTGSLLFGQSLQMADSTYYRIYTDTDKKTAEDIVSVMDSYLLLFNKYLHFDTAKLPGKLKIRLYSTKSDFDSYLKNTVSKTAESYVLLQYRDPSKNELVAYITSDLDKMRKDFIHYGFIQFMKAYIYYPPLWLMNGFAVYFENSSYSLEEGTVTFKENLDWVPTLKKAITDGTTIPIDRLLLADIPDITDKLSVFYSQSWGMIDFLLSSSYIDYNRVLWDSLSSLNKTATADENEAAVISSAFTWINKETFAADFISYVKSVHTFSDLIALGTDAYSKKEYEQAQQYFAEAIEKDSSREIPYYYLGLTNYALSDYTTAEDYYHTSLKYSSDKDRVFYALAVNAYADSRIDDSQLYIKSISERGKELYKDKISILEKRITEESKS